MIGRTAAAFTTWALLAACLGRPDAASMRGDGTDGDADAARVVAALCAAAATDDPERIGEQFARAHGGLHDLARETAAVDRELAGRLHRAKAAAESAIEHDDAATRLVMPRLLVLTRRSLAATGRPPASCPTDGETP